MSTLHYDNTYSLLTQLRGRKRLHLFSPDVLEHLYLYPEWHPLKRRSRVDLSDEQNMVFQRFWKHAAKECLVAELNEGDVLCIPKAWAHYTESIGTDVVEGPDGGPPLIGPSFSQTLRFEVDAK